MSRIRIGDWEKICKGYVRKNYIFYSENGVKYYYCLNEHGLLTAIEDGISEYSHVMLLGGKHLVSKLPTVDHVTYKRADFSSVPILMQGTETVLGNYTIFADIIVEGGKIRTPENYCFSECLFREVSFSSLHCSHAHIYKGTVGLLPYDGKTLVDANASSVACRFDNCIITRIRVLGTILDNVDVGPCLDGEGSHMYSCTGDQPHHYLEYPIKNINRTKE